MPSYDTRILRFQLGPRWKPTLSATIRKVTRDPTVQIDMKLSSTDNTYELTISSDKQAYIKIMRKLHDLVMGDIVKIDPTNTLRAKRDRRRRKRRKRELSN